MDSIQEINIQAGVSIQDLRKVEGKKVEVIAFNICYLGTLKKVDLKQGTIWITDKGDTAILEVERIQSFQVIG
ncbi:MAG: hypothetical protein Q7S00_08015 [bacterium]|nr:hypothetical protein [bacterium]